MRNFILVYDEDCGTCTWFKHAIQFLDPRRKITFVSHEGADKSGLLDGVAADHRYRSFHMISPDGSVYSASDGLAKTIQLLPAGTVISKAVASLPSGMKSLRFLYDAFSRLHERGRCSSNPVRRRIFGPYRSLLLQVHGIYKQAE